MEKQAFNIPNISCAHCTKAVENELSEMDGISSIESDVTAKSVTIQWDAPASLENILEVLKEINYPAAQ